MIFPPRDRPHKEVVIPLSKELTFGGPFEPGSLAIIIRGTNQHSDIKWNHFQGSFKIQDPKNKKYKFSCVIDSITDNCGAKTIYHVRMLDPKDAHLKFYWQMLESFLWTKCNCSLLVGSDSEYGGSKAIFDQVGFKYSDPIGNPNYGGRGESHKIVLAHKFNEAKDTRAWNELPASL
jgi:hypothetical protein